MVALPSSQTLRIRPSEASQPSAFIPTFTVQVLHPPSSATPTTMARDSKFRHHSSGDWDSGSVCTWRLRSLPNVVLLRLGTCER